MFTQEELNRNHLQTKLPLFFARAKWINGAGQELYDRTSVFWFSTPNPSEDEIQKEAELVLNKCNTSCRIYVEIEVFQTDPDPILWFTGPGKKIMDQKIYEAVRDAKTILYGLDKKRREEAVKYILEETAYCQSCKKIGCDCF